MTVRITLQEEMDRLQATLEQETELVLRALRGSINALREADPELADEVIGRASCRERVCWIV